MYNISKKSFGKVAALDLPEHLPNITPYLAWFHLVGTASTLAARYTVHVCACPCSVSFESTAMTNEHKIFEDLSMHEHASACVSRPLMGLLPKEFVYRHI